MLFRVLLLPTALSSAPANAEAAAFFYPAAISFLQDLAENCVLLVGPNNTEGRLSAVAALLDSVREWPEQYKIRAQRIMTYLEKAKRFHVPQNAYTVQPKCELLECKHAVGIAASLSNEKVVLFAGGGCTVCSRSSLPTAQVIEIRDYPVSEFCQKRRTKRSIVLKDGQWSTDEFEQWILSPILRHAEIVKLYDRVITRSAEIGTAGDSTEGGIQDNYRRTLEWIASVFARESTATTKIIEIHSGMSTGVDAKQLKKLEKDLQSFNEEISKKTGVRPSIFLREETERLRMPHGRYLITDKLGLLIERGFDLLWDDKAMKRAKKDPSKDKRLVRDVMVSICPDPGSIETAASRLRGIVVN